jgi:hypothetical protein
MMEGANSAMIYWRTFLNVTMYSKYNNNNKKKWCAQDNTEDRATTEPVSVSD